MAKAWQRSSGRVSGPIWCGATVSLGSIVVGILKHLKIFLHQLTPNAFVRLALYMWVCKTTKVTPWPEWFAYTRRVHKATSNCYRCLWKFGRRGQV